MLAVNRTSFFPPEPSLLPSHQQKCQWIDLAIASFRECLNNNQLIKNILIDGLFVHYQDRLLTIEDFQEHSLDEILASCIDALENPELPHLFQFRQCNVQRIIAYFNQLNLPDELLVFRPISAIERYKTSLSIYHAYVNSPHGRFYDQIMIDADIEQVEDIRQDKLLIEQLIFENIQLEFFVIENDYFMVFSG